ETEQRCQIYPPYGQIDVGGRVLRPWFDAALRVGIQPGSRHLDLQPQRRMPHAAHRSLELCRALPCRDGVIEPEQGQQRTALLRRHLRFEADFAAPERFEIERAQGGDGWLRGGGDGTLELRRVEVDHGARARKV